ncbi:MAG: hypothetical protein R6U98_20810 [Pirellulaceae bacterium]
MTTSNLNGQLLDALTAAHSTLVRTAGGITFRDLNKNGKLDVYEDPRQPVEARVADLLGQMTLAEKAGTLFINGSVVNEDGAIFDGGIEPDPDAQGPGRAASTQITEKQMTHFNVWAIPRAQAVATWYNNLQRLAEETRLGIPITIASARALHFITGCSKL